MSDEISWLEDVIAEGNKYEREEALAVRTELRTLKEERDKWELRLDSLGKINNAQLETMERQQTELAALREAIDSIASAADAPTGNHVRLYQIRKLCRKARTEGGG
jgi:hypothetical protein